MGSGKERRGFWRSPIWEWGLFAVLVACSSVIFWWPQTTKPQSPVKVELLPFPDSPPAWDGAYPQVRIFLPAAPAAKHFKFAVTQLPPTVRHEFPLNVIDVDLHTGKIILRQTDLFVSDVMPLSLTRTYVAWDYHSRAFGVGGNHPYDIAPTGTRLPYTYQDLNLEDGYQVHMPRISRGTSHADAVFRHNDTSSEFYGAQDAWNGNGWTFTFRDGQKMYFPEAYHAKSLAQGAATEMDDAGGHRILLKRSRSRNLEQLISPSGHTINFKYDYADRIVEAQDDSGKLCKYRYNDSGHLDSVSDAKGVLYRFEYQRLVNDKGYDPYLLTAVLDGDWNVLLRNKYLRGRVTEQRLSDGEVFRYNYQLKVADVLRATVTLPSGEKRAFSFHDGIPVNGN